MTSEEQYEILKQLIGLGEIDTIYREEEGTWNIESTWFNLHHKRQYQLKTYRSVWNEIVTTFNKHIVQVHSDKTPNKETIKWIHEDFLDKFSRFQVDDALNERYFDIFIDSNKKPIQN